MIKKILKIAIFLIFILLIYPNEAYANFGDLNYRINSVVIDGKIITFKGWAYIHRTNNYVTHGPNQYGGMYGDMNDGGQKILMQAYTYDNSGEEHVLETLTSDGYYDKYNFYLDLCNTGGALVDGKKDNGRNYCDYREYETRINSGGINSCGSDDEGVGNYSQCLYEDIEFSFTFDFSEWNSDVYFKIGATNNHFNNVLNVKSSLIGGVYSKERYYFYTADNKYYTLEKVFIPRSVVNCIFVEDGEDLKCRDNDYFVFDNSSFTDYVDFIASNGLISICENGNCSSESEFKINDSYGSYEINNGVYKGNCTSNRYLVGKPSFAEYYTLNPASNCGRDENGNWWCIPGLRMDRYFIYINPIPNDNVYCPSNAETGKFAIAYGSHVRRAGVSGFKVKQQPNNKKCSLSEPDGDILSCNNSKELISKCETLTVRTIEGTANVKIEQKGIISSVLTPDEIYAGGGVSLGLLYTNTIKWNYVDGNKPIYHESINNAMNDKIKDINSYISGIDVSELIIGDKIFNLVKKCTYSRDNGYYNDELIVSCLFTVPDSTINLDGSVFYHATGVNIINKYYTGLDYNGDYSIDAKIIGLDRIKSSDAENDSEDSKSGWTGNWDVKLKCSLNVYSLLLADGKNNFLYRPIDLINIFPDRNPGINWFEWYKDSANSMRLKNTYKNKYQYRTELNNAKITEIKEYNSNSNYLNWDSIDPNTYESSFVDKYVTRGAGGN